MKRALAMLLLPLAVACTRSEGATPAPETAAKVAAQAAARSGEAKAKKLTLLVTGDVGGKIAPCG
jgi:predicted alternative tryptophan synthase beta-subunit